MTREERNTCFSLASKSYAYIPTCDTEQSCYEKVSTMFKTNLGYEQEDALYFLKNNLGRSWFFYNKGVSEMKKVSLMCSSGDTSNLPGAINEARNDFEKAFELSDSALKQSIIIVSTEEQLLAKEDINYVKEEDLYGSLIELRQILSELSNNNSNSGSYVSYYLQKTNAFNNSIASKGFGYIIEKESFWTQEYDFLDNGLIEWAGTFKELEFRPISNGLANLLELAENKIFGGASLAELKKIPTSEIMTLYSNISGTNNSVMKRFSDLLNKTSTNYSNLITKRDNLIQENIKLKTKIENNLNEFNTLKKYSLILEKMNPSSTSKEYNISEELTKTMNKINETNELYQKHKITLGKHVFFLKEINTNLQTIDKLIEFNLNGNSSSMASFCNNFSRESQKLIEPSSQLKPLNDNIYFYSSKTLSNSSIEKLEYCTKLIVATDELKLAKDDYLKFESQKIDTTSECFNYVEKIFSEFSFKELENEFKKLKETEVNKDNILFFDESCNSIKNQLENELNDKYNLNFFKNKLKNIDKNLSILEEISKSLNDTKYESLRKQLDVINETIATKDLLYLGHVFEELNNNLASLDFKINDLTKKLIIDLAKRDKIILYSSNEIPEVNKDYNYSAKVILKNNYYKVEDNFGESFDLSSDKIINFDNCVSYITTGNKTTASYSCLNFGNTEFLVEGHQLIQTNETETIIYTTNEKSLIEKRILVKTPGENPKILFKTTALSNNFTILIDNIETNGVISGNTLSFYGSAISDKSNVSILFYLTGLLETNCSIISNVKNTLNSEKIIFECNIKNTTAYSIKPTIFLPINYNDYLKSVKVFDERGVPVSTKNVYKQVLIEKEEFEPKQLRTYKVELELDNAYEYYIKEIEDILKRIKDTNNSVLIEEGNSLLLLEPSTEFSSLAQNYITKSLKYLGIVDKEIENEKNQSLLVSSLEENILQSEEYLEKLKSLNLTTAEKILFDIITEGKAALDSKDLARIKKAILTFSKIKYDINKDMSNEISTIIKYLKDRKGDNVKLNEIYSKANDAKVTFDRFIEIDPIKSQLALVEIISLKDSFDKILFEFSDTNQLNQINSLLEECKNLINVLRVELSVEESKLVKARFIKPITISRLDSLENTINTIVSSDEIISDKKDKLLQIRAELKNSLDNIKKQTISAYNLAIDDKVNSTILGSAKEFIDKNRYVAAFLALNYDNQNQPNTTFPFMFFIPIVAIIVIGYVLRKKIIKSKEKTESTTKIIEDSWKD